MCIRDRHSVGQKDEENSGLAKAAFFFVVPWILISMFAGLGPPPETAVEWTATAKEQQARYFMPVSYTHLTLPTSDLV